MATETAGQLLSHVVPVCQWLPQNQPNPTSTLSAHPLFPETVSEWTGFFQGVGLTVDGALFVIPEGQFPSHATSAQPLRVEDDAKTRLYTNILFPVDTLLQQSVQGAIFCATPPGFLGLSDHVLCVNNSNNMPVDLRGYNLWDVCRNVDRVRIRNSDPNFKFKKRILSQVFGAMACNDLHYGILSNYSDTYFLKREEASPTTLYVSSVVQSDHSDDVNPTLRECVYYISRLALMDNIGNKVGRVESDNYSSSSDDDNDDDNDPPDNDWR